jgi:hypothetical protein
MKSAYKQTNSDFVLRVSDGVLIPPDAANTDYQRYQQWLAEGNTPDPVDPPDPLTPEQIVALRQSAYQAESDPIFFKWQRSEATQQEWLDKIAEIKARYPDPA